MALVVADRVKETTTTTGTGTLTLGGASTGFQSFAVIGNTNTTYYAISATGASFYEVGIGTYTSSGTTLSRDTVLASSNSGNKVDLPAGTKEVYVVYPAGRSVIVDGTSIAVPNNAVLPITAGGTGSNTATFSGANITTLNASNISSGTLSNSRTTASNSNGASTIVARNASGGFAAAAVNVTTLNSSGQVIDAIGNVRDIPQNAQTTGYTLVATDNGKHISTNSNVTVPSAVFSSGDVVAVYNSTSSNVTVIQGGSVTLRTAGTATTGNVTLLQYGVATILCTAANNFVITGTTG